MTNVDPDLRPSLTYFESVEEGRLRFQRCQDCTAAVFYPRIVCPKCGGVALSWEESAGYGSVYSVSVLPQRDRPPIVVALVDLDEGFRMMSWIVGPGAPEVEIGTRVVARFGVPEDAHRVTFVIGDPDAQF